MNFKRHNLRLLEFSFLTTTFHMPLLTSSSRGTLKAHVLVSQLKKTYYICINNKAQVLPPAMTSCTLEPSTTHRAQAYSDSLIQLMHCPPFSPSALFVSHAVCTASTISPILMGSTITLMWMVPSLSFANPKSSCWPTHFWLLNQTIHSHVHWPLTLNMGPEESTHPLPESLKTTRCYSQRPLTRYLWLFPSAYPGQDIPPFPRLPADALHVTCHLPKLHLLPTSLPKTRNSKKRLLSPLLYWTALVLTASFRDLYSYPASQLGELTS